MRRNAARWRTFASRLLLCACVGACARGQPASEAGPLARRLLADSAAHWRTVSITGVRLHFARAGTAGRASRAIADSVLVIRQELRALLGPPAANDTLRLADLFFLNSRDEMRRLAGRPLSGFIQQGEPTGVFVVTVGSHYGSLLRHELAHLHTFEAWGEPRAGRWFVEGVAAWAAGSCQGSTPDALAAGALVRRALPTLTELANNFDRVAEDVAVPQAASVVGFLVRREGIAALRHRWREESGTVHPLGQNGPALEATWLDELRGVPPATLDLPRLFVEGC
jgi:hypothetical protein